MAEWTGTLWEHDAIGIGVSCNHGFASVAAVLFLRALTGYLTTKEGKPIFDNQFKKENEYDAKVIFYCENGEIVAK